MEVGYRRPSDTTATPRGSPVDDVEDAMTMLLGWGAESRRPDVAVYQHQRLPTGPSRPPCSGGSEQIFEGQCSQMVGKKINFSRQRVRVIIHGDYCPSWHFEFHLVGLADRPSISCQKCEYKRRHEGILVGWRYGLEL
jgi:hypothetical protein